MTTSKLLFAFSTILALQFATYARSTVNVSTINEDVTVRRDARSIPYIAAGNDADLYFAQGYVTASDRLWQMDLLRRVARGETAEIFGATSLEQDKRWRQFGFGKIVEDSLRYLSPDLRAALESYSRGVNAYIATLDESTMPVEFKILQYKPREWKPSDSVVIGKILADALSSTWRNDLLRASISDLPTDKFADLTNQVTPYDVVLFGKDAPAKSVATSPTKMSVSETLLARAYQADKIRAESLAQIGFYAEDLAASNNWVISGKRTADGKPILANDPHLLPAAPGIWYLTHLSTPATRVSGVTFPGVPGIVLGHNENIAWGATNVGPDVQDLYIESFDADGKYKTPTGLAAPVVRKEEIKVRVSPFKTETQTVTLDVVETRNGPIIAEEGGKKYALKWTALDPKNSEFEAFYFLNRAKDWSGFKDALRSYGGAMQNFVYADVKGNIGWYAAGKVPLRKTGDGGLPYDGSTNDGEWVGTIPFDELPNLYNPPSGFILTANQRIVGTAYKYFNLLSRDAAPPWRARRIHDLLDSNSKITMDDVSSIQHDVYNVPLTNLAKRIVELGTASADTTAILKAWDGRMTPESKAAVVVNEIRICLANRMAEVNKPAPNYLIRERVLDWAIKDRSSRWLPTTFRDYGDLVKTCDSDSRAALADPRRLGPDDSKWTWGAIARSRFPHPLAIAPLIGGQFATPAVPIAGSGQTPNVASAVSMRHIASPGNWDLTRHVIPLGESGDPRSPYYKDQFDSWRTGTPSIFPFSKAAVEKLAKVELVLHAGKQ